ncbi:helix-turn-helix domain-containing protein [Lactobacillus sp. CC-MHH1034]|uniref:helix-turn-helix domain-containing protein n=1 Tax=Agrilactobacillus fermenti TaxID=2586909 RepID=UPI001E4DCBA5|nr:helix-turn-helix domain-containing protein [Agrilactobacillus fermenti]MCD2256935.1 helix-turn-helix domain-containing protein [Agrilactobacillus fermenti]
MSHIFEELFFNKADNEKFQMFRVLNTLDAETFTLNDIGTEMHMSYQKTYNIYQGLLDDMFALDPEIKEENLNKKNISAANFPVSVDSYRLFLLKGSIIFQAFDYAFQTQTPSIDEFCNTHFISKSTLLRKMAKLREFMNSYSMSISTTNLRFEGDERQVRFFIFCIYWIGFHGQEWPLRFIDFNSVRPVVRRANTAVNDPILELQNILFFAISRVRIVNGYLIEDMSAFNSFFYDDNEKQHPFLTNDDYPRLTYDDLLNESLYFYFYDIVTGRVEHLPDESTRYLYQYNREHNTVLWQFTDEFFDFIADYYDVNSKVQERALNTNVQLVSNLMRLVLSYEVMKIPRIKLIDFYDPERLEYKQSTLWDIITLFFERKKRQHRFENLMPFQESLTSEIYYLMLPYLKVLKTGQLVKVKVLIERGDLVSRDIFIFLEDLNNITILPRNAPLDDADLIITSLDTPSQLDDVLPPNIDRHKVIKWNLDARDIDFYNLYLKIKHRFLEKISR